MSSVTQIHQPVLRPIPGLEGKYAAGDDGHIWSLTRGIPFRLKSRPNKKNKYHQVSVYDGLGAFGFNKVPKIKYVHLLMASAWLGPKPGSEFSIDHEDRDRGNNRVTNLRWMLQIENARRHLPQPCKLTTDLVVELRRRYAAGGVTQKMLAAQYGVSDPLISRIVNRKLWQHVA